MRMISWTYLTLCSYATGPPSSEERNEGEIKTNNRKKKQESVLCRLYMKSYYKFILILGFGILPDLVAAGRGGNASWSWMSGAVGPAVVLPTGVFWTPGLGAVRTGGG